MGIFSTESIISSLPDDSLMRIFSFLPNPYAFASVCKRWRNIIFSEDDSTTSPQSSASKIQFFLWKEIIKNHLPLHYNILAQQKLTAKDWKQLHLKILNRSKWHQALITKSFKVEILQKNSSRFDTYHDAVLTHVAKPTPLFHLLSPQTFRHFLTLIENEKNNYTTSSKHLYSIPRKAIEFKINETAIACIFSEGKITIWDRQTAECITSKVHEEGFRHLQKGSNFFVCSLGKDVVILRPFKTDITLKGHEDLVSSVHINKEEPLCIISGSADKTVRVWSWQNNQIVTTDLKKIEFQANAIDSNDNKFFCIAGAYLFIWDRNAPQSCLQLKSLSGYTFNTLAKSGNLIATGTFNGEVMIWNQNTGNCFRTLHVGYLQLHHLSFDSYHLICGAKRVIYIWDIIINKQIGYLPLELAGFPYDDIENISQFSVNDNHMIVGVQSNDFPATIVKFTPIKYPKPSFCTLI